MKIISSYTVYWNSRERMKTHKAVGKLSFGPDKVSKKDRADIWEFDKKYSFDEGVVGWRDIT